MGESLSGDSAYTAGRSRLLEELQRLKPPHPWQTELQEAHSRAYAAIKNGDI